MVSLPTIAALKKVLVNSSKLTTNQILDRENRIIATEDAGFVNNDILNDPIEQIQEQETERQEEAEAAFVQEEELEAEQEAEYEEDLDDWYDELGDEDDSPVYGEDNLGEDEAKLRNDTAGLEDPKNTIKENSTNQGDSTTPPGSTTTEQEAIISDSNNSIATQLAALNNDFLKSLSAQLQNNPEIANGTNTAAPQIRSEIGLNRDNNNDRSA